MPLLFALEYFLLDGIARVLPTTAPAPIYYWLIRLQDVPVLPLFAALAIVAFAIASKWPRVGELAGDVLGILRDENAAGGNGDADREAALIEMLIEMRTQARAAKDFARADVIRKRLTELGVTLEDGPKGTGYRITG